MNRRLFATAVLILTFGSVNLSAQEAADVQQEPVKPVAGITVYMDVGVMGRTNRAAERMTELHQEYFSKGMNVIDVDPYIENGDLQGFFITYVGLD